MKKVVFTFLLCCTLVMLYSFTINTESIALKSSIEIFEGLEVEVHYYEESEFVVVLEETISNMTNNPEKQQVLIRKGSEEGIYGISSPIPSNGDHGDVERCGDCGPTVDEVMSQLSHEPCWWLIDFSNHVWGWDNGC